MNNVIKFITIILLLCSFWASAQINTPLGATNPFGSNASYPNGILPTNLPTGGAFGRSQDAANAYNEWKAFYVDETCAGGTQARVKFDELSKTVSEGVAYGMLLSVYAADKPLFDKLWRYYKATSNGNGIMNWKINGCSGTDGANGATDAELDVAMALLIAEEQWPAINTPYDYQAEASTLITAVRNHEIHPTSFQAVNGDGWGFGNNCRNPSYQSPAYYRYYKVRNPSEGVIWDNATTAAYSLINANAHPTTGLVSDWSDPAGVRNTCNGGFNGYGYDACRSPWRMGVDAIWHNTPSAVSICNKIAAYCTSRGVGNIGGPVNQDGSGGGAHNATFVSMYASAIVGAGVSHQTLMNNIYTETRNVKDNLQGGFPSGYFGNSLRCISLFVMTGNFWRPGTQAAQEINIRVATINIPSASTYDFQNHISTGTKDVTFTIENAGSNTLNLSGTPRVAVTSGGANFSVFTQPAATSLAGGATTTFVVRFTPSTLGLKTGTISIANNDANENPYVINLTGTGTATATTPELEVLQNTTNITTGASYNFGPITNGSTIVRSFTINNTGTAPLNITSTVVSGTIYSLESAPAASVAIGGSTTFSIRLTPTALGTPTATLTLTNNDPDEVNFVINLTASVTNCATSIATTRVLQDYDANRNISLAFNPAGPINVALANPFPGPINTSATVASYTRLATGTYDVIRYLSCGAFVPVAADKPLVSFLIYSPIAGRTIIFSMKNAGGTAVRDVTVQTTKANQWERLYFDMSPIIGNTTVTNFDIMIDPVVAPGIARVYYLDDIRFDESPCITDLPASEIFNDYDDHRNLSLAFNPTGAFNTVFANPFSGGLNTSPLVARYTRLATGTFDVIRYSSCNSAAINLNGKTTISFLVYSPAIGIDVIMSLKTGTGVTVLDRTTKTTVANQWQRLYFDFESIKNNTTVRSFDIMIDPATPPGVERIYLLDDIRYDLNPCYAGIAGSNVMQDYNSNRFLTMANTNLAFNDLVTNPSATGINTSSTVGRLNRPATGLYNLIRYNPCGTNFDLSLGKTIYAMDVYSPVANARVYMTLKAANGTTTIVEDSALVTAANTWQTLTFDFSSQLGNNLGTLLDVYLDPNIQFGARTYHIDNIRFGDAVPEINIRQGPVNVLTGTSFSMGTIAVGSSSLEIPFSIQNNGTGNLLLSGVPIISVAGANAVDFIVDQSVLTPSIGPVSSRSFTVIFTPTTGGVKTATLTIANNDSGENPYVITLTGTATCIASGAATTIVGPASACANATGLLFNVPLVANASGYTWSFPVGASITDGVNTNAVTVTWGTVAGNVTVTPTNVCGNGAISPLKAVAVSTVPAAAGTITGPASVCGGATGQVFSIVAPLGANGYTWILPVGASITAGSSSESITVTWGTTAGNVTVTPTNTCGNGTISPNRAVAITALPAAAGTITGPASLCSGVTGQVFSIVAPLGATGYTWALPVGASITAGSSSESITVTWGTTAGNVTVTPTNTCGNGTISPNRTVAITALPAAAGTITGPASVCGGATGQVFSIVAPLGANSYTWILPVGASITAGSSSESITVTWGTTAGNVTVTPTNTCGNGTISPNRAVAITALPAAAGTITGPASVCSGALGQVFSVVAPLGATGYTWILPVGASITAGSSSESITVTWGTTAGNVTVTPTNTCGNGTISPNRAVAITALPAAAGTITGPASVCSGASGLGFSITPVANATSYTWTLPSGASVTAGNNSASVTIAWGATAGNITVLPTNTCANGSISPNKAVSVSGSANPAGVVAGTPTVCSGATGVSYSIASVAGATSYSWTVPAGATITNGSVTSDVTVTFGTTSGNVVATPISSCGNGAPSTPFAVTVNPSASAAGSITGLASACSGQTNVSYSIVPVGGATGYTWTVPTGTSITSGNTTASITLNFGTTAGNVTVTPTSTCGNGALASQAIVLSTAPNAAGTINGNASICNGASGQTFTINAVTGASGYTWSVPSGSTITAGSSTISITMTFGGVAGFVTVTPTNSCGNGTLSSFSVAVNTGICTPPTTQAISGPNSVTTGQTVTYSVPAPAFGSSYSWTFPLGTTLVSSTTDNSSVTLLIGATSGSIGMTETNPAGSTISSLPISVGSSTNVWASSSPVLAAKAFPTPFADITTVRVTSELTAPISIVIADAKGVVVFSSAVYFTNQDVVVGSELSQGVYYVEVSFQGKVEVLKLVKL